MSSKAQGLINRPDLIGKLPLRITKPEIQVIKKRMVQDEVSTILNDDRSNDGPDVKRDRAIATVMQDQDHRDFQDAVENQLIYVWNSGNRNAEFVANRVIEKLQPLLMKSTAKKKTTKKKRKKKG